MIRVYFDTEFTGLHQYTTLVSIGCCTDDGREFYAVLSDYDCGQVDEWLQNNVIDNLYSITAFIGDTQSVAGALKNWLIGLSDTIEMVSDVPAYDWVLFCQLYGHAFAIPDCVCPAPVDINQMIAQWKHITSQEAFNENREQLAGEITGEKHNALHDALCIRSIYQRIAAAQEQLTLV